MKTQFSIETLKSLSPRQCVLLANFLYPEYKWRYAKPTEELKDWNGHDIVSGKYNNITGFDALLQIDYREQINNEPSRIRLYINNVLQDPPENNLILSFLKSIRKIN